MGMIHGETVYLIERIQVGVDEFGAPFWIEQPTAVEDVLIMPSTMAAATAVTDSTGLHSRKAQFMICIPRNDPHDWPDHKVEFWGKKWHVFSSAEQWIDSMAPLKWNKRYQVEAYEQG